MRVKLEVSLADAELLCEALSCLSQEWGDDTARLSHYIYASAEETRFLAQYPESEEDGDDHR